uniref:Uncharacterized protein n=1 Tax=Ganoderma sinense TaxID=36075 RepID=V5KVR0_9APHY|nr:hypothetical protein Gasi_Mp47 [Ganoderma sinense]AHA41757.1 hypothetical protein Gasi_Mp47 [Ganoderma sinense]
MFIKIKNTIKLILSNYYKILKLQTGYNGMNLFQSFLILIFGILTLFLREDIFISLNNYPKILILIWFSGIFYSLFVGINLLCRLTLIPLMGIPFFKKEIKKNKEVLKFFIAYLIFNISLIVFSILVLIRLSTFYLNYHGDSFYGFMLYELTLILFIVSLGEKNSLKNIWPSILLRCLIGNLNSDFRLLSL